MMAELAHGGPVAVGITVPASFEAYRGGIYTETAAERAARLDGAKADGMEPTGHAVLVVGYGVENGTKYWCATPGALRRFRARPRLAAAGGVAD